MKTKELVMKIHALHIDGVSQRKIAQKLGIHRKTVNTYLSNLEKSLAKRSYKRRTGKLDNYRDNVTEWLRDDPAYQATTIYDRLTRQGFVGSYDIVKRLVRTIKGEREKIAYIRYS